MPATEWTHARHVLCIRLDALGDVLMTTPALRAVKQAMPDRRVTLLTSPGGAAIAGMLTDVDHTLTYEAPWMKASPARVEPQAEEHLLERLRAEHFDAAIIFTVFSQNPLPAALMCYLAGIPLRLAHCRENPYQLLTDWVPETEPNAQLRHEVRRQLDLVATVGCRTVDERLSLSVAPRDVATVKQRLAAIGLTPKGHWIVVHPGASAASRRYPPELYAEAVEQLAVEHGIGIVFTGSRSEAPLVEAIRSRLTVPSTSFAGELTLGELAALIASAPLLLTNNTGPAHLAAALATPVVDLYALTNPQHAPWQVPQRLLFHDVPCKFCFRSVCPLAHHDCLRRVPPERVAAAVIDLLAETSVTISDPNATPAALAAPPTFDTPVLAWGV